MADQSPLRRRSTIHFTPAVPRKVACLSQPHQGQVPLRTRHRGRNRPSEQVYVYYPRLFSSAPHSNWQQNINTSWQIVDHTVPATAEHTRFTYWIEDLAGYIDANVAGNIDGTGSTHYRSLGYDPKEVALFHSTSNTSAQADPGNTWATTLVGDHPILFTPWSYSGGR